MLTARQVLALACRAEISVIRWSDGIPLDVGRRYRTETPAIRRALAGRDQGCRFPGCGIPAAAPPPTTSDPGKTAAYHAASTTPPCSASCTTRYYIHLLGWTITGNPNAHLALHPPRRRPSPWIAPRPAKTKPRAP